MTPDQLQQMMAGQQMRGMGRVPSPVMPQQAQGVPQGRPFQGTMPQRPAMPQQAQMPAQAFGGPRPAMSQQPAPGVLSQGMPQQPQMRIDPAILQQLMARFAGR